MSTHTLPMANVTHLKESVRRPDHQKTFPPAPSRYQQPNGTDLPTQWVGLERWLTGLTERTFGQDMSLGTAYPYPLPVTGTDSATGEIGEKQGYSQGMRQTCLTWRYYPLFDMYIGSVGDFSYQGHLCIDLHPRL